VIVAIVIVAALAGGLFLLLAGCSGGQRDSRPAVEGNDDASREDAGAVPSIDPALIHYQQVAEIPVGMKMVRALAVGPDDHIYVGGDEMLRAFTPAGGKLAEIPLDGPPKCLAVGGADHAVPGQVYVGMDEHVESYDAKLARTKTWKTLGDKAALTSIATADDDVFLADAGNRVVWRYSPAGELKGRIGAPDKARNIRGFVITSHYFDLAVGADGLLYVVNPRALRLEAYTFDGDLEFHWGEGSPGIDGFFGCCNPAHFAVLPDGRFVTAEKGARRIKVYSAKGQFECVVAGPEQVGATAEVAAPDVAVDRHGRILALDPVTTSVRVFERKP
jgi:hypothetical protein